MVDFKEFDFDSNEKEKADLLARAEELAASEDAGALREASNLKKRWNRLSGDWESMSDEELNERFEAALDKIFAKRNDLLKSSEEVKKALIVKANEVLSMENFAQASKAMNGLMDEWKASGSAGKDTDDALWEQFNAARKAFFEKKNKFFEERGERMAAAKVAKEALIAKAKELSESTEWKATTEAMTKMMDEWKAAGTSGKDTDDGLWAEFSAARKVFFDAKKKHFAELETIYAERAAKKNALVEKAQEYLAEGKFTKETTEKVKALRAEWKEIGNCGKSKEDAIWEKFNGTIAQYFDGLKARNSQKHEDWVARMNATISAKEAEIERSKKQINRWRNEAKDSLRESAVREAEDLIKEEEEYIASIEKDIADLKAKIEK